MGCVFTKLGSKPRLDTIPSEDFSVISDLGAYSRIGDNVSARPFENELVEKCEKEELSSPLNLESPMEPLQKNHNPIRYSWITDPNSISPPTSYADFLLQSDFALSHRLHAQPHHSQTSYITLKDKTTRFSSCAYSGFSSQCRKTCQDRVLFNTLTIRKPLSFKKQQYGLFCVFDGHGESGENVSQFLVQNLSKSLEKCLRKSEDELEAFLTTYDLLQKQLEDTSSFSCEYSGSTATCILLSDTGHVFVSSIGDSRAVIAQTTAEGERDLYISTDLTFDHNFDKNQAELERVTKYGGVVRQVNNSGAASGPMRVWLRDAETPGLAVSRAFGDLIGTLCGICSIPEVSKRLITHDDKFIIIASDGVWDNLKSQEAVDFIDAQNQSDEACRKLVLEAARRSITSSGKFGQGVCDDIAAIVVYL